MLKRLREIEDKIMAKHRPEARIVFVEQFRDETRAEAQTRYEKEHSLKPMSSDNYIFINIPSDEQIRKRNK